MEIGLSRELSSYHFEVNEDGHQYPHEGYCQERCSKCGDLFIVAQKMKGRITDCGKNHKVAC